MLHGLTFGYTLLGLTVLASALCLPFPSEIVLLAAGALVSSNGLRFSFVFMISVSACLVGDAIWFEAGRYWGRGIIRILMSFSDDPRYTTQRATRLFERWGSITVVLTKFVPGLDTVTVPLAGVEGVSRRNFYLFDTLGAMLWTSLYVALGWLFTDRVNAVSGWIHRFGTILSLSIFIPLLSFAIWRIWSTSMMIRRLKTRRMSPRLLYRKMTAGKKLAIIDLANFELQDLETRVLPGAVRLDPARLRRKSRLEAPDDVQIVLYGSSDSVFRSARVALSLQRKGLASMWILEGGLEAWTAAGLPTAIQFETEAQGAARLGIQIYEDL